MEEETGRSMVYLLRLWPSRSESDPRWRVALISPDDGQRRGFATLEALCAYLNQQCARGAGNERASSNS